MTKSHSRRLTLLSGVAFLAGCQKVANVTGRGTAAGVRTGGQAATTTAQQANPDMAQVLNTLTELGAKPVSTLDVTQARSQASPADAVRRVQQRSGQSAAPRSLAQVKEISIPSPNGAIPARLYVPTRTTALQPLIVYWHGGGWVIADLDTYDASARALAAETGAIVLSAHYRQAPEHKFPAAQDDAIVAYAWAARNARRLGVDLSRIAVAGESAGGNLAINTAIAARDQKLPRPVHMLLIYPVAGTDTNTPSYLENTVAVPLSRGDILWYVDKFTRSTLDLQDSRLDVYRKANLAGLPPATIINAEIDPLRSDGELLAQRLQAAGVVTEQRTFRGVTHEFFGMAPVVSEAVVAQTYAAQRLQTAFGRAGSAA